MRFITNNIIYSTGKISLSVLRLENWKRKIGFEFAKSYTFQESGNLENIEKFVKCSKIELVEKKIDWKKKKFVKN